MNHNNIINRDHNQYLTFKLEMLAMSYRHKTINELYLWSKLRHESRDRAGYFDIKSLSSHQRYKILPKLRNKGWIHSFKNKTLRYRTIAGRMCSLAITVKMPVQCLESKADFKAFIHDAVVKYQLEGNYRYTAKEFIGKNIGKKRYDASSRTYYRKSKLYNNSRLSDRDENFRRAFYKARKFNSEENNSTQFEGRLARINTANFLSVSEGTITRFRRKKSQNNYVVNRRIYDHPQQIHPLLKYYFDSKSGKYFTIDTTITTNVISFVDRHARNKDRLRKILSRNGFIKGLPGEHAYDRRMEVQNYMNNLGKENVSKSPLYVFGATDDLFSL